jgi:hypothetical protein
MNNIIDEETAKKKAKRALIEDLILFTILTLLSIFEVLAFCRLQKSMNLLWIYISLPLFLAVWLTSILIFLKTKELIFSLLSRKSQWGVLTLNFFTFKSLTALILLAAYIEEKPSIAIETQILAIIFITCLIIWAILALIAKK